MTKPAYCMVCGAPLGQTEVAGEARLACSSDDCDHVHWNNPTPVVAAVVEYGDDVILVRNVGWPETWFGLVSGFLEAAEHPAEAIVREIKEELDLDAEVVSLIGLYPFDRANQIIMAYHVKATGNVTIGAELAAFKQVPAHKLKPWPFGTGHAVRDWLASRGK